MRHIFFAVVFLLIISGCSFNKAKQHEGELFLQGKWAEDSIENKSQLISYQQHEFIFTCDSFYVKIKSYSKINLNGGPCFDKTSWEEYAKGYYTLAKDTLKLEGNFVSEKYKYKPEKSCYRVGKYNEQFILIAQKEQELIIKSLETSLSHQLLLKQKIVCNANKN